MKQDPNAPHIMNPASLLPYLGEKPRLGSRVFVASGARVIGDVEVGDDASIWFNVVIRGDVHFVKIGARTNVQDNATLHVTHGVSPCVVGSDVTIGHNAIVHACTVEDLCLIGMGAIILDKAVIGRESVVGAGALVTQGKVFPPRSMILGSPAKVVRSLTDEELAGLKASAQNYVQSARNYRG